VKRNLHGHEGGDGHRHHDRHGGSRRAVTENPPFRQSAATPSNFFVRKLRSLRREMLRRISIE
jgi:hypothetical protein